MFNGNENINNNQINYNNGNQLNHNDNSNQINYNNSNQLNYNGDSQLGQGSGYQPNFVIEHQWQPYTSGPDSMNFNSEKPKKVKKVKVKKEKKPLTFKKVFATCVAFMMITILANSAILYVAYDSIKDSYMTKNEFASESIKSTSDTIENLVSDAGTQATLSVAQIAEAVMPSVVAITSTSMVQNNSYPFWGYGESYPAEGAGSGIIVGKNDTELLVVTNNHVVEDTTALTVQFTNDVSVDRAYVKGTSSDNDIAMVAIPLDAIDTATINYIKIAALGDSDQMRVGDGVIAIGNALGYGQSLTVGYVSAKDREITTEDTTLTVIQTDAAINGGNSGGALLNMKGEVIGINVAKSSASSFNEASVEGMGYAIPISQAKDIIDELSNKETRYPVAEEDKGYLGIKVMTSDEAAYEYYNIPRGAYIREIVEGGPAEKAGLAEGDVIVSFDGTSISTAEELLDILDTYAAGETVKMKVMVRNSREYEEQEFTITLVDQDKIS